MTMSEAAAGPGSVIDEIGTLGPFFAVRTHLAGSAPSRPWQGISELLRDPDVLAGRVTAVRNSLAGAGGQHPAAIEPRVAASVSHLGLAARLVSPALAAAVLRGRLLDLDLRDVHWQPILGGPVPLSVPSGWARDPGRPGAPATPEHLAELLDRHLVNGGLSELEAAMEPFSVSTRVLRGNIASAVNGAAAMITASRPRLAQRTRTIASLLLARPPLRGAATVTADGAFRRRSCCLIYRASPGAGGAVCGDCVLSGAPPPGVGRRRAR